MTPTRDDAIRQAILAASAVYAGRAWTAWMLDWMTEIDQTAAGALRAALSAALDPEGGRYARAAAWGAAKAAATLDPDEALRLAAAAIADAAQAVKEGG